MHLHQPFAMSPRQVAHSSICFVFVFPCVPACVLACVQGPHVFMVRIRDDQLRLMPGVRIKDHGPKVQWDGVGCHAVCWSCVQLLPDLTAVVWVVFVPLHAVGYGCGDAYSLVMCVQLSAMQDIVLYVASSMCVCLSMYPMLN